MLKGMCAPLCQCAPIATIRPIRFASGGNELVSPNQRRLLDEPLIGPSIWGQLNPFNRIKMIMRLNKATNFDPDFNIKEFGFGISKAAVAVAQMIKARDFEALHDVLPKTLVAKIEQASNFLNDTVYDTLVGFTEEDVGLSMVTDVQLEQNDDNGVMLHIFAIVVVNRDWEKTQKPEYWIETHPISMLTVNLQLSKRLQPSPPETDFIISALNFFHPFELALRLAKKH